MMATWLEEHGVELVVLAGYMHLLTKPFLDRFPGRIVNVHPSLLPAFPGAHAIDDALAPGVETTGVDGPPRRRGPRHRPGAPRRRRCRSSRATRSERADPRRRAPAAARGGERSCRMRALISVYDKARHRRRSRAASPSSAASSSRRGGTAAFLEERGLDGDAVEEVTAAPGDARRPRQDAPPAHPRRRSSRGATCEDDVADARGARDRAVRPRLRQPLPVRVGRRAGAASTRRRRSR